MHYTSTRDGSHKKNFGEIAIGGIAPDGGLYVPNRLPEEIAPTSKPAWPKDDYIALAERIIQPFIGDTVPGEVLTKLLEQAYAPFNDPRITPLKQLDDQLSILELTHGPSLAFKDIAMQLMGQLFGYLLAQRKQEITIISATSGDTGSAAVAAFAGIPRVKLIVLHPQGRVSDFQRRQMTTSGADNVHIIAVEGTFDDCQQMVKILLNYAALRETKQLAAINSINWTRIIAQMVYYIFAQQQQNKLVTFAVPTGNFGNIYAAHLVQRAGWPIGQLVIGNNANDAITQLVQTGKVQRNTVIPTISNAIDIQIPSNLERYLWELFKQDGKKLTSWLANLQQTSQAILAPEQHIQLRQDFQAASIGEEKTRETMRDIYQRFGYIIDPHTAVGIAAANECLPPEQPRIALACAAPQKFQSVVESVLNQKLDFMDPLATKQEIFQVLPADLTRIKHAILAIT